MRVGIGFDVHPLVEGRALILGGVGIPHDKGLAGHSDADVLVHAVMDALLGAADLGDIGAHFPPSDPTFKDISSMTLLQRVADLLSDRGLEVGNIDVVVAAERPMLSPFIPEMRRRVGDVLGIDSGRVTIKATTTEGLGFVGRGEGIAAQAVALVERREINIDV